MGDLRNFARRIKVRAQEFEEDTNRLVRKVALAVDTAVVLATPVDTGRARANWQVGIGEPKVGTLPEPASPGGGAQLALDSAASSIATYNGEGTIHITNNLPYIEALNNGHSSQAPAGFVERAVAAARTALEDGSLLK